MPLEGAGLSSPALILRVRRLWNCSSGSLNEIFVGWALCFMQPFIFAPGLATTLASKTKQTIRDF
jgi:hypothetical protein